MCFFFGNQVGKIIGSVRFPGDADVGLIQPDLLQNERPPKDGGQNIHVDEQLLKGRKRGMAAGIGQFESPDGRRKIKRIDFDFIYGCFPVQGLGNLLGQNRLENGGKNQETGKADQQNDNEDGDQDFFQKTHEGHLLKDFDGEPAVFAESRGIRVQGIFLHTTFCSA
ncbi:MAG: hypothetical protein BWX45_00783 [Deltaproteobacteria bacterium ADurb.Bin002]|nr:MAG: hypothetical protein BWX45_00783 [Deltaproteobacteria bacterium ADurb.Bin002]